MTEAELAAALNDEVSSLQREEAANATKAERAADPTLALPAPAPAAPEAAGTANQARAAMGALTALPPELITPILIAALDLVGRRIAQWLGGEKAGERYALKADERELLNEVWLPVIKMYLPQLQVHPLLAAGGFTALIYGLKALPEGGLEAVLGGAGGVPVPRAVAPPQQPQPAHVPVQKFEPPARPAPPATPQQLVNPPAPDPVLALAQKKQAELKVKREAKEAVPA